ncbi:ArnT family glycosyltransferase [Amycolatopsis sp. NPDC058986]|uniref:ArnT family glycosyltransferase n=1 Tax=unclassified Amycolatopsis TaxID=2618356 RepID=UPI00366C418B
MTTAARPAETTSVPPGETTAAPTRPRWQPYALAAIVVLSLLLYGWGIGSEGWGNTFYSAAVKSMGQSLTNFLFGAYDPAGVVTVDKPPMALWPQVFSTWIFGFHGWSLLLPQVIEGGAAVFLLHRTVRRWAGENVALLAALVLALTPITVAINRDNNPDTLLVLLCVAAAYAFTRSVEPGITSRSATKWLLQAAFWCGCCFVTKMLAGWMIVPALGLAYLFGRNAPWQRKALDLLIATGVLLVSSLWWVALTAWWPGEKPYIGGSADGSAWDLIIGYNGLGRVFGQKIGPNGGSMGGPGGPGAMVGGPGGPGGGPGPEFTVGAGFGGDAGISRLFGSEVGGQISWLIPAALLVLIAVAVAGVLRWRRKEPADHFGRAGWWLWGSWLVVIGLVFSYQEGIFHSYYTTQLAPAIAALIAAGAAVFWRYYRAPAGYSWLLLPAGVALTAVWAWVVISRDTSWHGWLRYAVAAAGVLAVAGLVVARLVKTGAGARVAAVLGVVTMLVTPGAWSVAKAATSTGGGLGGGTLPSAGPNTGMPGGIHIAGGGGPGMPNVQELEEIMTTGKTPGGRRIGGAELSEEQRGILDYVTAHSGDAKIKLAVEGGSMGSAGYIINSDATIIGMGGFMGGDDAPSVDKLAAWQRDGALGFVLSSAKEDANKQGRRGGLGMSEASTARIAWVQQHCTAVPPSAYGGSAPEPRTGQRMMLPGGESDTLYDCRGK